MKDFAIGKFFSKVYTMYNMFNIPIVLKIIKFQTFSK